MEVRRSDVLGRSLGLISILWSVHLLNIVLGMQLVRLGIAPRQLDGILGIILCPLLHIDLSHLVGNSLILMPLLVILYDSYSPKHVNTLVLKTALLSGLLVWMFGRGNAVHVGASCLAYGLFVYAPVSAIRYKKMFLLLFSSILIFLCGGSMLSGMLTIGTNVSWEGHLMGAVTGFMLAIFEDDYSPIKEEKGDDNDPLRPHCLSSSRPPQDSGMAAKEMESEDTD